MHPIHAGKQMGAGAVLCCVVAIGLLIVLIVAQVSGWWLLPMFALTEVVVYRAFSSNVRQRRRDLALLRCFGASRAQVFNGVLTEAAWVGVLGALAGFFGVLILLDILDFNLAVFAAVVGATGAVLAALVPAFRASRIPPSGPSERPPRRLSTVA
ncbi:FtsX-like permease family protein [Kibdelosporangium persicum]|nr:FtsX-like permease family protein [Kibdelosporangium persicum]